MQNAGIMIIVAIPIIFQPEMRRALSPIWVRGALFSTEPLFFPKGKEFFE